MDCLTEFEISKVTDRIIQSISHRVLFCVGDQPTCLPTNQSSTQARTQARDRPLKIRLILLSFTLSLSVLSLVLILPIVATAEIESIYLSIGFILAYSRKPLPFDFSTDETVLHSFTEYLNHLDHKHINTFSY